MNKYYIGAILYNGFYNTQDIFYKYLVIDFTYFLFKDIILSPFKRFIASDS